MLRAVLCATAASALQAPANDLVFRLARGEKVERAPVWLFRQAGRHMQEYRDYKAKTGKHFLQLLDDPKDVAEVTMQPLRRYQVDAAILFSDILVVPQALDIRVEMPGGVGIVVPEPLTTAAMVDEAAAKARADPASLVAKRLKHVTRGVEEVRSAQLAENLDRTLLGFSAAPYTLFFYSVGGSSKNRAPGADFAKANAQSTAGLLEAYTDLVVEYLSAQAKAGAHCLQVFEAMGMTLGAEAFEELALPHLEALATKLKARHPDVPLLVFARGVAEPLKVNLRLQAAGYDVITLDGETPRHEARDSLGPAQVLQGDFDPKLLLPDSSQEAIHAEVEAMLTAFGPDKLLANLGEGLGGKEDQGLVDFFVNDVHATSAEMIARA
jgi:uroporphyrinogen decarboxylase